MKDGAMVTPMRTAGDGTFGEYLSPGQGHKGRWGKRIDDT
jgi:hypothetical protein